MFAEDDVIKSHKRRVDIITNMIFLAFTVIVARLWFLQIYQGDVFYQYSLENRLRKEIVKAPRGMIFSRNNKLIVYNIPRFDAIITPQYLKNKNQSIEKLAGILKMTSKTIKESLRKNARQARYRPIIIKKNISRREVAIIETEHSKMPGIGVQTFISREYTDKNVGGHLLGYISEISQSQLPQYRKRDMFNYRLGDFIGQSGLEEKHDFELRGRDGHEFMEVDARGLMKRHVLSNNLFKGIENKPALPGNNIRLTIDRDLQLSAYNALEGKVGSVVAVDVNTGEILTMISRPGFDPSKFSRGLSIEYWNKLINDENNPLRDRTIQEHYPPGSTFKTITAIAALEEGIVDENTEVHCKGKFRLGRRTFHCWKRWGHGKVNLVKAIKESCDVYFYKIAMRLDIDVIKRYANMFGLGNKTEIELPRETSGLIPSKDWKRKRNGKEWILGETLLCAIGQSYVLSTTLQLALAYASIANGGTRYHPHLIKEIFSNSGQIRKKVTPVVASQINISKKTFDLIKKGLFKVVNERKGTAWWYRGSGIRMSGKTGTSQVIRLVGEKLFSKCEEHEYRHRNHGLFVGFAPRVEPRIAVSVIVEHGCHGSTAAAPVARAVITTYMKKYFPELRKKYIAEERKEFLREKKRIEREKQKQKQKQKKAMSIAV